MLNLSNANLLDGYDFNSQVKSRSQTNAEPCYKLVFNYASLMLVIPSSLKPLVVDLLHLPCISDILESGCSNVEI
jgi:hypothetical protein